MKELNEAREQLLNILMRPTGTTNVKRDIDDILSLKGDGWRLVTVRDWDLEIGETDTHGIPCNPLCHNMERRLLCGDNYRQVI